MKRLPLGELRGRLLDRTGEPLAANQPEFTALLLAEQAGAIEAAISKLRLLVDVTPEDVERAKHKASQQSRYLPVELLTGLTWEEMALIEVNLPDLPGIVVEQTQRRIYPLGAAGAHVTGYLAEPSNLDDPLQANAAKVGQRVGRMGAERAFEADLQGRAGLSEMEVNVRGRPIRELGRAEGHAGRDVTLTIDAGLQRYVSERLAGERSAAAVVMDVHNGEILALASQPSYDPNLFADGITAGEWTPIADDVDAPMLNKAIGGQYAPGSTFKMIVLLAALTSGAIDPQHTVFCPGYFELGTSRFHCWKRGGHGRVNPLTAVKKSCDVFFYDTSLRVGIEAIAAMARSFGLGSKLNVGLAGEQGGLIPSSAWKEAELGSPWRQGETVVAAIGQGYVTATPLQLATMVARLVNGGAAVVPRLARADFGPAASLGLPAEYLELIGRPAPPKCGGSAWRSEAVESAATAISTGPCAITRSSSDTLLF